MDKSTKRVIWIDAVRIIATWGIICLHTRAVSYYEVDCYSNTWLIICGWGELVKWAVPVFVMISGTLMLDRDIPMKRLYCHNIGKMLGAKAISCLAMFGIMIFYAIYFGGFSWEKSLKTAFSDNAMWFLFMMIGLYMVQPFLREICKKKKMEEYFLLLCIGFTVLFPMTELINGFAGETIRALHDSMYLYFPVGYITYFVLGHYLYNYCQKWKKKSVCIGLVAFISWIFNIYIDANYIRYDKEWVNVLHDQTITIGIFVFSTMIFLLCMFYFPNLDKKVENSKIEKWIHHAGRNCIGIYVLHWPLLTVLSWFNVVPSAGRYLVGVPLETTVVFIICILCTLIWEHIPVINKVLG